MSADRIRSRGSAARWLAVTAFLVFVVSGGGRVVGSDEVTMLELSRSMLRGRLDVPSGATLQGPDGRSYTKNAAGQAVLAIPLVAAGEGLAALTGFSEPRRTLVVRFVTSFFNAAVAALLLALLFSTCRRLGLSARTALAASALLGFTTPLWVYAKSFMAEPLQGLGLLLVFFGAVRAHAGERVGAWVATAGAWLAVSAKLSMLPLVLVAIIALRGAFGGRASVPLLGLAAALACHAVYNLARFGTAFETGYGAQATPSAYSTPIWVGLYGLLLSPGKGIFWFAPALWLAVAGWSAMRGKRGVAATCAIAAALVAGLALLLYGTFEHWAGDGSFGPRYLVPILPLGMLAVAFGLDAGRRRLAWLLALAGLVVQLGGVSVYFGAQMREAGDYPYRLALNDPRFMSDSHFNPAFSPILGHWRMLGRNLGEHLRGDLPRLDPGEATDPRLGVGEADQRRLLHALDYWWLYAAYAGFPSAAILIAVLALLAATFLASRRLWAAVRVETDPP